MTEDAASKLKVDYPNWKVRLTVSNNLEIVAYMQIIRKLGQRPMSKAGTFYYTVNGRNSKFIPKHVFSGWMTQNEALEKLCYHVETATGGKVTKVILQQPVLGAVSYVQRAKNEHHHCLSSEQGKAEIASSWPQLRSNHLQSIADLKLTPPQVVRQGVPVVLLTQAQNLPSKSASDSEVAFISQTTNQEGEYHSVSSFNTSDAEVYNVEYVYDDAKEELETNDAIEQIQIPDSVTSTFASQSINVEKPISGPATSASSLVFGQHDPSQPNKLMDINRLVHNDVAAAVDVADNADNVEVLVDNDNENDDDGMEVHNDTESIGIASIIEFDVPSNLEDKTSTFSLESVLPADSNALYFDVGDKNFNVTIFMNDDENQVCYVNVNHSHVNRSAKYKPKSLYYNIWHKGVNKRLHLLSGWMTKLDVLEYIWNYFGSNLVRNLQLSIPNHKRLSSSAMRRPSQSQSIKRTRKNDADIETASVCKVDLNETTIFIVAGSDPKERARAPKPWLEK